MKTLTAMILATFLGLGTAVAQADDAVAKPKSARAQPTAAAAATADTPVAVSQQDKMRQCSKQASGKKGAERKDFMKTCLAKKVKA
jgi:hypothetical protein